MSEKSKPPTARPSTIQDPSKPCHNPQNNETPPPKPKSQETMLSCLHKENGQLYNQTTITMDQHTYAKKTISAKSNGDTTQENLTQDIIVRTEKRTIQSLNGHIEIPNIEPGDHIYVERDWFCVTQRIRICYQHHAIYVGKGKVVHFSPPEDVISNEKNADTCRIIEDSLERFVYDAKEIYIKTYSSSFWSWLRAPKGTTSVWQPLPREEIVRRAHSRLGESGYSLLQNNCESFCTWCVTDVCASEQVRGHVTNALAIGGTAVAIGAAVVGVASLGIGLLWKYKKSTTSETQEEKNINTSRDNDNNASKENGKNIPKENVELKDEK